VAPSGLSLFEVCFAGGEPGLYQEELVEDEPPRGYFEALPVGGEVDLMHCIVQIRQPVVCENHRR
jgi:hypothetical protein